MPGAKDAVIESGRKKRSLIICDGILVIAAALAFVFIPIHPGVTTGKIAGKAFSLEIAKTSEAREKGLSGRSELKPDRGMIFVFDTPDKQCFWMKDMKFPIDILWFDSGKKLVYEIRGLSPSTYPESFCSPSSAQYVVELPAGTAARLNTNNGTQLELEKL